MNNMPFLHIYKRILKTDQTCFTSYGVLTYIEMLKTRQTPRHYDLIKDLDLSRAI